MVSTGVAEEAVRSYLLYLDDPEQLVDQELVSELQQQIDAASDPLDRLIALAKYERARTPSEEQYRDAFIEHANAWAQEHEVTPAAFEQLGVSPEVLQAAGLATSDGPTATGGSTRSVTVDELKQTALKIRGSFTSADLVQTAGGGSPMTVRKALNQLTDEGRLERIGPDPDWSAKGRAPILYRPS